MNDELMNYRPGGAWCTVLDVTAVIARLRGNVPRERETAAHELRRLAWRFELYPGQRERDLAQLFLVLADFAEGEDYALEDEDCGESEEDKPLAGDKRA